MNLLVDVGMLAIIIICLWSGYKKGIIMGIGAIAVLIVSAVAGNALSTAYSQEVIPAMEPFANGYVSSLVKEEVYTALKISDSEKSIADLIEENPSIISEVATETYKRLGIAEVSAESMAQETIEYIAEQDASIYDAATQIVCSKVAFAIGFLIFSLLCLIILTVVGNIVNFSYRIPYIGMSNEIGGAVLGTILGLCFCMIIGWTLRFAGLILPDGLIENSMVLEYFVNHNMIASYLGF